MRKNSLSAHPGMPFRRGSLCVAGMLLTLPALPTTTAIAQDGSGISIEEITVTASRREESLQDTALSVIAVNPDEFVSGGLTSLQEVVSYSPGVYFRGGSAPVDNGITIRGVSTFTSAPTVGVYIDDIPLGSSTPQASGASLVFDAMKAGMERVEIIKGPQGTSFGSSSMGGLLRYVSGDPSKGEFGGNVSADFSNTDHGGTNQRYTGKITAPSADGRFGVSLSGYYEDVEGFIDRIASSPTGAAKNVNGWENYGGMLKLSANITDKFNISLLGLYDETTFQGRNAVALDGPPFVPANGPYETDTAHEENLSEFKLGGLTLSYDFGFASLVSSTSYQERYVEAISDLRTDFGALITLFCTLDRGSADTCGVQNAPYTGWYSTDRFVQELRLVSKSAEKAAGNIEWSIGAIYSEEESGAGQRLIGFPADFLLLDVNIPSWLDELAFFANFTYFITSDFDITVGARVAEIDASVAVVDGPELLINDTPRTSIDDTVDTYSFQARYGPADNLSLYARIASGYRPATANLPVLDENGNSFVPAIIETDTLWSYEIGAKGWFLDGKLSYDTAIWYLNWKNLQARIYVNGVQTGGNANADVTAYGFEGAIHYMPVNDFTLSASLAYTRSTLDDDETSAFGAVKGENLPLIPKITAALRANKTFALGANATASIGLGVRYVDDQDTGFEGGIGRDGSTITPRIVNFDVDDRFVTDLNVGFEFGNFGISLYATNLFDEYGYLSGSARPQLTFIRATASVAEPRTIGGIVKYKF